ncbi:hypothetical protein GCM10029976_071100 [Kribbella albertanoniae]|uniref:Uncharacterized protein n=1 Tax=Kribbella albertanoniae TaxID=1266829 RepID=A0A4R4PJR4_9ACTN|nr:hypothetical protein [Kribbella albertanoniae]TDC22206.1 hypothetical protein E1261_31595 [Kribbella albertanoniae]
MKASILRAAVGVVAVLGGLLVASPAQAADGPDSVRVRYPSWTSISGGEASATLDFVGEKTVVFRNFKVRDICPGDGRPVRAYMTLWEENAVRRTWDSPKADINGCGGDGTNFGTVTLRTSLTVARAGLTVCVYTNSAGNLRCVYSGGRDNPYVRAPGTGR